MLTYFQSVFLGIIQGITEFLPISSSAHLILAPYFFKFKDPGLTFDVALHFGTAIAVIGYYWKKWIALFKAGFSNRRSSDGKLFWIIIASTIPAAVLGYFFEDFAETIFRNPKLIAFMLIIFAVVLFIADRFGKKTASISDVNFKKGILIGFAQALAIMPGVSRSGITMTSSLFLGLNREDSANFSFLLSTPIVLGAAGMELRHIDKTFFSPEIVCGIIASAVSGIIAIHFLLKFLKRFSFLPLCIYRFILGIVIIVF